ncbi:MAG: hypothetical protein CMO55_28625 [Verrucomicrobiales bacterium]|nr:hypothetical protein [Verrucomicrobiales bacterium]
MKLRILSLCIGSLFVGALLSKQFAPRVSAVTEIDLGKVSPETVIRTSFKISNSGHRALRVFDFKSDCGCATIASEEIWIEPKKFTEVKVLIRVPKGDSQRSFKVIYRTNDSDLPYSTCRFEMVAEYGVKLTPGRVVYLPLGGSDLGGSDGKQIVTAKVSDSRPDFTSLEVESEVDFIEAESLLLNDREGQILIRLKNPFICGEFKAHVSVIYRLGNEAISSADILVCGRADDQVVAIPSIARLSLSDQRELRVHVKGNPKSSPEIELYGFGENVIRGDFEDDNVLLISLDDGMEKPDAGAAILRWPAEEMSLSVPVSVER